MSLQLQNVTFDCADPRRVGGFWSEVLGVDLEPGVSEFYAAIAPAGGPRWLFLKVPEPKTAKSRMHVDFVAEDAEAEIGRIVALGATRVAEKDEWGVRWTVLMDPEGHEFCIAHGSD
jgi:predicted enzyme related to lactoylglutathione lyase